MKSLLCSLCVSFAASHALPAAEPEWKPLFKPGDLSGWVNVNCAPDTWTIKDGVVACTGKPTGALRTEQQYENFELELEWRHLKPGGNAGIFVWASAGAAPGVPFLRSIEVQVLDNGYDAKGKNVSYTTHGDVFPIHGSAMTPMRPQNHKGDRCFPNEERSKPSPEWNHYRIVANNGSIRLSVNGKEVSGGDKCNWRKGYLGLESEGSPTEWRNLKIKELPSTGATAEQSAPVASAWRPRSISNGLIAIDDTAGAVHVSSTTSSPSSSTTFPSRITNLTKSRTNEPSFLRTGPNRAMRSEADGSSSGNSSASRAMDHIKCERTSSTFGRSPSWQRFHEKSSFSTSV